jgi:hypothetical protein
MKASDVDKDQPPLRQAPTTREWARVVGAAIVLVLIFTVWTFWG